MYYVLVEFSKIKIQQYVILFYAFFLQLKFDSKRTIFSFILFLTIAMSHGNVIFSPLDLSFNQSCTKYEFLEHN